MNAPAGRDGLAALSEVSGLSRAEAERIWAEVRANHARLATCARHRFVPLDPAGSRLRPRWVCEECFGTVDAIARQWYELGRAHGAIGDCG